MNVLVDTGVWIAFCDPRDHHDQREAVGQLLDGLGSATVLLPWPVVYETVRTRLARFAPALRRLEVLLARRNIAFINDVPYRENALRLVFEMSVRKRPPRPLSMVDCLLRLMIEDRQLKIDRFATFNDGDFADVCRSRVIEIVR